MGNVIAYGTDASDNPIKKLRIKRRVITSDDVEIKILYCGICHSDIHLAKNDWGVTQYPIVPGHEIVGKIIKLGRNVTKFKIGDIVGVGCIVDSCKSCNACNEGLEQYCENGSTGTYNSRDIKYGGITYGGYSEKIVVNQNFVLSIPKNLPLISVPPLLCAGITVWSPLKQWKASNKDIVGIIGLGGLGHMGLKLSKALGAKVILITTSSAKGKDSLTLGADKFLLSTDKEQLQEYQNSFDLLLNTVPNNHNLNIYLNLLKRDGTMVLLGALESFEKAQLQGISLILQRKRLAGSIIGGIKETQEMLNFCGQHNITSNVELIKPTQINNAYKRVLSNDVKYRFVIDFTSH